MSVPANQNKIRGPILALDLGGTRVGVALSDELSISIRRLEPLLRTNWKQLLRDVDAIVRRFDAKTMVIGLPLSLDGTVGTAALEVQRTAKKFSQSLEIEIYLQDERLSSVEASERLRYEGIASSVNSSLIDSESAVIILRDFLDDNQDRLRIKPQTDP